MIDNKKLEELRKNGWSWHPTSGGSGGSAFVVGVVAGEDGALIADKSFEQIREAAKTQPVILISSWDSDSGYGVYYHHVPLAAINNDAAIFIERQIDLDVYATSDGTYYYYRILYDGTITREVLDEGSAPV